MHIGIRSHGGNHFCGGSQHENGHCRYLAQYAIRLTWSTQLSGPSVHVVFTNTVRELGEFSLTMKGARRLALALLSISEGMHERDSFSCDESTDTIEEKREGQQPLDKSTKDFLSIPEELRGII
jgi:hypothetical protein